MLFGIQLKWINIPKSPPLKPKLKKKKDYHHAITNEFQQQNMKNKMITYIGVLLSAN